MSVRLPAKKRGGDREAVEWNRMVDALAALLPKAGPNQQTNLTTRGTFRIPKAQQGGGGTGDDNLVWL